MTAAGAGAARAQDSSHAVVLTNLYARLRNAATRVCEPQRSRQLTDYGFPACYDSAMADAVRQINKSTLTKVYKEHNGAASLGIG